MKNLKLFSAFAFVFSSLSYLAIDPVNAQSITPSVDGTGTQVIQSGNTYTIQGGATSSDQANLFHQFERFGLNANEIANFLANPQTRNIFGSIIGGDPSIINGLIRVTGGSPNLFLSNPAGILFGANARLDLPGSLTVTTANGISFGDKWLSTLGSNDYAALVGNPTGFTFTMVQPGAIVNSGNLSVPAGQSVMLVGGTVINTGTIVAPGGNITIAAIPGTNRVRISQAGRLLSLELAAEQDPAGVQPLPFSPRILPDLLTIGKVTNLDLPIPTEGGTAVVSGQLSVATNLSTAQTPQINILGQKVGLIAARVDASGENGGGTIRIGGDYQGKGTVFNSDRTFVSSDSVINADALNRGNGGRVIIWSNDATQFYGRISAQGGALNGDGGFAEVSGKNQLNFQGLADLRAVNGKQGSLLLDPTDITISAAPATGSNILNTILQNQLDLSDVTISTASGLAQAGDITVSAPITWNTASRLASRPTNLTLLADRNITISPSANITTNGGDITLTAVGSLDIKNANITTNGGNFKGIGKGNTTTAIGININSRSSIDVGSGKIELRGSGGDLANNSNPGLVLSSDSILKAAGDGLIFLHGEGGNTTQGQGGNYGVQIDGSIQTTGKASITIEGIGGTSTAGDKNFGITSASGNITSIDGKIILTGKGGNATNAGNSGSGHVGISLSGTNIKSTGEGEITLVGEGTSLQGSSHGIRLSGKVTISSTSGNIELKNETSAPGGSGIVISNDGSQENVIESIGSGNIKLDGKTQAFSNVGVQIGGLPAKISAANGNVEISGVFTGTNNSDNNRGVSISNARIEAPKGDVRFSSPNGSQAINLGNLSTSSRILNLPGVTAFDNPLTLSADTIIADSFVAEVIGNNNPVLPGAAPLRLEANQITVRNIISAPGQSITLVSQGDITTGDINSSSPTAGGEISLSSSNGGVFTGNLTSSGPSGGSISIIARTAVTTGVINASGSVGNGGNVFIDPIGDVQVTSINTQGGINGIGGNVDITAGQLFRATGTFVDRNNTLASISTAGGQGGGNIIITHGTGTLGFPFIIGDPSRSGTAGAITSGTFRLEPQQQIIGPFTLGNIQLITTDPQSPPEKRPAPVPTPEPKNHPEVQYFPVLDPGIYEGNKGGIDKQLAEPIQRFYQPPKLASVDPDGSLPLRQPSTNPATGQTTTPAPIAPSANPVPATGQTVTPAPTIPSANPTTATGQTTTPAPTASQNPGGDNAVAPTIENPKPRTLSEVRNQLTQIEQATGVRPALIYAVFARTTPLTDGPATQTKSQKPDLLWKFNASTTPFTLSEAVAQAQAFPQDDDRLELILVTANGSVVRKPVILDDTHKAVTRKEIQAQVKEFREKITAPNSRNQPFDLKLAQELYRSLVQPLEEEELKPRRIGNLLFLMDQGLRSLPIAALHDGQKYLVEKYSLGLSPSLNLTDTRYADPRRANLLAMGRADFSTDTDRDDNLPGARTEIAEILRIWRDKGKSFLDAESTKDKLFSERKSQGYGIVHLATHAMFAEDWQKSYIKLWDSQLTLERMSELHWYDPPIELVVLSACQTAKDSEKAELGFAGFAVRAGAKSALASLWSVSDAGTIPLMLEFYQHLHDAQNPIKAEALRQAQISMIQGNLKVENGQLTGLDKDKSIAMPKEVQNISNLSHPYYWAGFTLIGSPW